MLVASKGVGEEVLIFLVGLDDWPAPPVLFKSLKQVSASEAHLMSHTYVCSDNV